MLSHNIVGVELGIGTHDTVDDGAHELNRTMDMPVGPVRHTIQVCSGRNSNLTKTLDAAGGQIVRFQRGGRYILPIFLLSFVVPSPALPLTAE